MHKSTEEVTYTISTYYSSSLVCLSKNLTIMRLESQTGMHFPEDIFCSLKTDKIHVKTLELNSHLSYNISYTNINKQFVTSGNAWCVTV